MTLSIKTKFTLLSAILIGITCFNAYDTRKVSGEIVDQAADLYTALQLVHHHMEADMMHDAIHGDVLRASFAVKTGDAATLAEAKKDAAEHIGTLKESFDFNIKLNTDETLKNDFEGAGGDLKNYEASALAFFPAAESDIRNKTLETEKLLPEFQKAFSALEEKMDKVSQDLDKYAATQKDEVDDTALKGEHVQSILAMLSLFIAILIPVLSQVWIFGPVGKLIDAMSALSTGRSDVAIPYAARKDEVGKIADALLVFKQNGEEKIRLEKAQEEQKKAAEIERKRAMNNLADTFESGVMGVVDTVASAATEMDMTARDVVGQSEGNGKKLTGLIQGIETSAQNVQTVASAAAQLSSSITEINTQVTRSVRITADAVQEARRANETSQSLSDAAQKIGNVINVINEIAGQINLLALNATIEAARAGEAGKGFAVVASEVKNLANQTTKATQEIEGQVSMIQTAAGDTVKVIQIISGTIGEINSISSSIAAAVEEQGMATQEIARNVQQASDITNTISADAGEVHQSAASTTAAATQMVNAARELSVQSEKLKGQVDHFLNGVRAG